MLLFKFDISFLSQCFFIISQAAGFQLLAPLHLTNEPNVHYLSKKQIQINILIEEWCTKVTNILQVRAH